MASDLWVSVLSQGLASARRGAGQANLAGIRRCHAPDTVWINGHLMGTHPAVIPASTMTSADVARCGEDKDNVVLVRVDASEFRGVVVQGVRHLSPCLAYPGRSLARGPLGHLCHHTCYQRGGDPPYRYARLILTVGLRRGMHARSTILDARGATVAQVETTAAIAAGTSLVWNRMPGGPTAIVVARPPLSLSSGQRGAAMSDQWWMRSRRLWGFAISSSPRIGDSS